MLGIVIADRYELLEKIGEGGMALVFKAKDLKLQRVVAVKVLKEEYLQDSEFVKKANNYPAAIVVAISFAFLELEERDSVKLEQIRRLFDIEKATAPIRAS